MMLILSTNGRFFESHSNKILFFFKQKYVSIQLNASIKKYFFLLFFIFPISILKKHNKHSTPEDVLKNV